MRTPMTMNDLRQLRGTVVHATDGDKVGTVEQVYLDVETDEPQWLAINTGIMGGRSSFVPLRDASFDESGIRVPYTKDQINGAPEVVPDAISQHSERELFRYYGFEVTGPEHGSAEPAPGTPQAGYGQPEQQTGTPQTGYGQPQEQQAGYQHPDYRQPAETGHQDESLRARLRRWQWERENR